MDDLAQGMSDAPLPAELVAALRGARRVVVFTGAGVSAESGIPTFRDALGGLWQRFDAAELATADAFRRNPELVWGRYEWRRMKALQARPNPAHLAIAALAERVEQLTLVTQNVDDLHERAGSTGVIHLHGSLHAPRCFACAHPWSFAAAVPQEPEGGRLLAPPRCPRCAGPIRPGVVWFGESLPEEALERAFAAAGDCDLLLAVGTSGVVMPAARLPFLARSAGARVLQVNPGSSPLDDACDWNLRLAAGTALPRLLHAAFGGEASTTG